MALVIASCSTKKNTGMTRFWHAFNARYNTYFNGAQAYIDASVEKENGNKDNFTELLPLYTVGNKASRDIGKAKYDIAITKAQKAIQIHSIKAKPVWNKDRKKTDKDIAWLTRKEYNPFLWKAWMLMGRSQFYKGEFDEAAATFAYMSRLYKGQPAIYGKAQAWLTKCYVESAWIYSAEDVIRNMQRDSLDWRAKKEWDYSLCDYYLHTGDLPLATQYLRKVIKHEMRAKQRAREYYILGQIEAAQGHKQEAFQAFKKVLSQHPDYEHRFNANVAMSEVMATGQSKKMISRLKRMARNDNNKEYLDQIYYAIGNIYLADKDTTNAIAAYEKGNKGATRSGIEKGVLLLHLGDLYWAKEKFGDAKRCYGEAIGLLDKDRKDYEELSNRSKILDELVPYTDAVQLQDSLQELSRLPKDELNKKLDIIIDNLKKKEKEEADKKWEEEQAKNGANGSSSSNSSNGLNSSASTSNSSNLSTLTSNPSSNIWYFYNTTAVQQGKQQFINKWGKRENKDDWQRSNKTVVGGIGSFDDVDAQDSITQAHNDSIIQAQDSIEARLDSAVNDPHKREYYLAQIPFTDEQKAESNKIIMDGLFHSAVIFKDQLDNLPLSEKAFRRLEEQYPEFEPKDETYYHLFLLYSRKGQPDMADTYITKLKNNCPDSKWTAIVTDPYFKENARFGKELEDSLYGATYDAFKADRFTEVSDNYNVSENRFPLGANRDRFIFINGMTKLNEGKVKECLENMEKVVTDYPQSAVSEMAGMIINGVKAGRRLHATKFDLSNVWDRRTGVFNSTDSLTAAHLSTERNTDFDVVLAYVPDSLASLPSRGGAGGEAENQLLFQLARYNFTNFLVRDFDLRIDDVQGMHHMTVSGFQNFDEARQYAKLLSEQESIKPFIQLPSLQREGLGVGPRTKSARILVISKENLDLIGQQYSYNDYDTFYVHHFAPLTHVPRHIEGLYEPVTQSTDESIKSTDNDSIKPILPNEEVAPKGVKPVDQKTEEEQLNDENSILIEDNPELNKTEEFVIPIETEENKSKDDIIIIEDGSTSSPQAKKSLDKVEDEYYDLDGF